MTLYTIRSGATAHPENSVLQFYTDFIKESGVVSLANSDFEVTEQATPDMTVLVADGKAYIKGSSTNAYPVRSTANENVTITSNSSGNPRKDAIVLYIDLSETPNTDASDVAKLVAVAGTPAASPQPPTDSEIATSIGSSNPFLRLANLTVVSGASSIENDDIEDTRVRAILQGALSTLVTDTDGTTITFDLEEAGIHSVTLGGNRTLAVSNVSIGQVFIIKLIQDGTGSRTVNWFSTINWAGGSAPTLTTTANKADVFGFICTGTNSYDGFIVGQNLNT